MDAKCAYKAQKHEAKRRGIEWRFTFESWLAWWGDAIGNRGVRKGQLGMCRVGDKGPYSPENVFMGTPKDNARSRGNSIANKKADKAKAEREAALNAMMWAPSMEAPDELDDDGVSLPFEPGMVYMPLQTHATFLIDKDL